ncbi:uncharacterized protein LOC110010844 isoform X2 [Jatropha curcas]|uniref:uncharacterized protein LOC110010844 isoform X2 n=1 Tax=Jatropha curcas TaxID=180498 RepID=UPI0009D79106|nr:uncharacterized protein LOC110010844 isoform X2 [Jatropha curcas]
MEEVQPSGFCWSPHTVNDKKETTWCKQYRDVNVMPNSKYSNSAKDKRACLDSSARSRTKACREKMRRDRLNERFMDLYSILEPGNFQNSNKVAILRYAAHLLNHLRIEAKELKDKNKFLQETIENLKVTYSLFCFLLLHFTQLQPIYIYSQVLYMHLEELWHIFHLILYINNVCKDCLYLSSQIEVS